MDEIEILKETLNSTLQRQNRIAAAYEVEIANMTAEIVRLRSVIDELEGILKPKEPKAESGGSLSVEES